jgi:hypothetical protein
MNKYTLFAPPGTSEDEIRVAIAQIGPIHFREVEHSPVTIPDRGNFIRVSFMATNDGAYDRICRKLDAVEL